MIIVIFAISAAKGPSAQGVERQTRAEPSWASLRAGPGFWDQGILSVFKLDHLSIVKDYGIKDLPLNEAFLVFALLGLLANIVARSASWPSSLRLGKF